MISPSSPVPPAPLRPRTAARSRAVVSALAASALVALLATTGASNAQDGESDGEQPTARQVVSLTTPDGSRFVLVPDIAEDPVPVLHWMVLTPTGPSFDPPGLEGLARAVTRASLAGTRTRGTHDWTSELRALQERGRLDREIQALLIGAARDEDETAELLAGQRMARLDAIEVARDLSDPLAWQRRLANAPAVRIELRETSHAAVLGLTTRPDALPTVASLLVDRRENATLRTVYDEYPAVHAELRAAERERTALLRRDAVGLAYLGSAEARVPTEQPGAFDYSTAWSTWQRIAHPSNSLHVLAGGFDPDEVVPLLQAAFARTELPAALSRPREGSAQGMSRNSRIPTDGPEALAIALHPDLALNPGAVVEPFEIRLVARWLADGSDSLLARELRRRGFNEPETSFLYPFPPDVPDGLLLLEVLSTSPTDPSGALFGSIREILAEAVKDGPDDRDLQRAFAAETAARSRRLADDRELAFDMALAVGLLGENPLNLIDPRTMPDPQRITALAQALWRDAARTTVQIQR